ncbi:MAG: ABC transporter permease [Bacteroidia bacterium]|nr:MAG: ABC transporter permease [Bacteroidia bacterium]
MLSPGQITWRKFLRIPTAIAGMLWIGFTALLALLGYLVIPDRTPFANHQQLEISTHSPGTRMTMLYVTKNQEFKAPPLLQRIFFGKPKPYNTIPVQRVMFNADTLFYEVYAGQPGYPGLEGFYNLADVLYPLDREWEPVQISPDSLLFKDIRGNFILRSIGDMVQEAERSNIRERRFLLGTDRFGRDMLSQLVIGARVSLSVGFIAVFISLVIGITLGSLAGFFRGRTDQLIVWLINVVWSIPTLLLAIAITFALGKGFWQVFVAVGLTMWVEVARLVRGQVISVREQAFVESARALGLGSFRIIRRHILPVIMGPVVVISAANFASAILIEAGLSFLGIGVQPPMPSWGTMIREHYGYIILEKGYLAFLPGFAIMLLVLAFMLVGNGLRDALDKTGGV